MGPDIWLTDLAAIEAEAVAAERARLREVVEGLRDRTYEVTPPAGHPIVLGFSERVLAALEEPDAR